MSAPARVPAYRVQDDALQVLLSFPQGCTNKDEVLQDLARDLLDARKALCLFLDTTAYDPSRAGETVSLQPCIEAAHAALPGWQVIESRPKE